MQLREYTGHFYSIHSIGTYTMKRIYKDGHERCRLCGFPIVPNSINIVYHRVAEYRENNNRPWIEKAHLQCDLDTPSCTEEVPEGYTRYQGAVIGPNTMEINLDRGLTKETVVVSKMFRYYINRNAKCIFFANQILVDIPNTVVEEYLTW